MEETVSAVKEVAKTTGLAIGTIDRLGRFFAKVMAEPIDATCGMLGDILKYKRWERQIRLVEKAESLMKAKNLTDKSVPISPKLALPIFQNASVEDDDFLHDLYARLLVSAIDPSVRTRRTAFAEILRQLESLDVKILQAMYTIYVEKEERWEARFGKKKRNSAPRPPTRISISKRELLDNIPANDSDYWEAVDNLFRLGLASSYFEEGSIDFDSDDYYHSEDVVTSHGGYDSLCITALGVAFVRVCNYS